MKRKNRADQPQTRPEASPGLWRRYRTEMLVGLALVAMTSIVYWRACDNDFVNYDDEDYVTQNRHVQMGLTGESISWAFTSVHAANWHPLTWLSLQLDHELYNPSQPDPRSPGQTILKARGFHLTNVVLHTANALLLFLALRLMTGAVWRSAIVAALFALHPLHVESVAWVTERKDVLSTFFWMLALLAYWWYAKRPSGVRYLLVALALALGLMAKPMLVTLPCVLLLLDYWPLRRFRCPTDSLGEETTLFPPAPWRRLILEKLPLLTLSAASCMATVFAQHQAIKTIQQVSLANRVLNALVAYVTYLVKTLWPTGLAPLYPHRGDAMPIWQPIAAALVLVMVSAVALRRARGQPYLIVGWLWFLGTLVPVIGLVQVGLQSLADRYTYVPLIGVFLLGVWGATDLLTRWRCPLSLASSLAVAVLAACAVLTWQQIGHWRNSQSLWEHALAVTANNAIAHNNLGFILFQKGQMAQAKHHFGEAIRINPRFADAHYNLGAVLFVEGRPEEALAHVDTALRFDPANADAHYTRGMALARLDRFEEAATAHRQAIRLNPEIARYHAELAYALHELGQTQPANEHYALAIRLQSQWPQLADRAAWDLATHPDSHGRNGLRALQLAKQACQATHNERPDYLDTLAAAYAEAGKFDEAEKTAGQALELAKTKRPDLVPAIEERLRLYRQGQPYRERPK